MRDGQAYKLLTKRRKTRKKKTRKSARRTRSGWKVVVRSKERGKEREKRGHDGPRRQKHNL